MWVVFLIILFVALIFKLFWAILKPIFIFIYEGMVSLLNSSTGMSKQAARALISLIVIIIIIIMILS